MQRREKIGGYWKNKKIKLLKWLYHFAIINRMAYNMRS